ncbi:metal-dependent hydrolase, partial [Acinetobacter baumannii]|uniref:metal-dependent hydrolase n=1 Tax=Acinetobacter baumannii TaxID=470 RepID=UPI001F550482
MTVYGTQLLLRLTDRPFGVGSIIIIDPLYTVPLLAGVAAALRATPSGRRWNPLGLALSTAYLGWSALAPPHVTELARASLARQGN